MVANNSEYGSPLQATSSTTGSSRREIISREAAVHDAELVRRFKLGDEDAFVAIVGRYREKMFSIAHCHLRNHADAEEVAQDTFIRAHRGLASFRGDSSLATWLHRIAFNLSRNRHKHNFSRRRHATLSLDCAFSDDNRETIADLIACEAPSPARETTAREFSEITLRCMEKLGGRQREILMLRNGFGQSYDDIARALGIKIGTVKSRIGRARESLRRLLADAYPEMASEVSGANWFEPIRSMGRVAMACA
jgi:RNA polymerase sigma-70 factor (ECF subfamily)